LGVLAYLSILFDISFLLIVIFYSSVVAKDYRLNWWLFYIPASCIIGIAISSCFTCCCKGRNIFGAYCLSAWGGLSAGILLYNTIIYKINSPIIIWLLSGILAIVYVILMSFYFDHMLIHSSSMAGSFWFIFGIGLVAGHYTNPF